MEKYINHLMERRHLNYVQMAARCHCSCNTVKRWCREGSMPQNRETFIKIALGFGLDLEETNALLQHYGKYPSLYGKTMEDAVCIFLVNQRMEEGDSYELYLQRKECLVKKLQEYEQVGGKPKDTLDLEAGLMKQETVEQFQIFVMENAEEFGRSFAKLAEFVEMFIRDKSENNHFKKEI